MVKIGRGLSQTEKTNRLRRGRELSQTEKMDQYRSDIELFWPIFGVWLSNSAS